MTGKLQKNEKGEWVIWHKKDSDICASDGGNLPVHSKHKFWLQIWGEEGSTMNYEIHDGCAILKAESSIQKNYPQD
jgi:hypothetical protein